MMRLNLLQTGQSNVVSAEALNKAYEVAKQIMQGYEEIPVENRTLQYVIFAQAALNTCFRNAIGVDAKDTDDITLNDDSLDHLENFELDDSKSDSPNKEKIKYIKSARKALDLDLPTRLKDYSQIKDIAEWLIAVIKAKNDLSQEKLEGANVHEKDLKEIYDLLEITEESYSSSSLFLPGYSSYVDNYQTAGVESDNLLETGESLSSPANSNRTLKVMI